MPRSITGFKKPLFQPGCGIEIIDNARLTNPINLLLEGVGLLFELRDPDGRVPCAFLHNIAQKLHDTQEARLRAHNWLPVQLFEPANGAFRVCRQLDERYIAVGGSCNADKAVILVSPLRQVGVSRARIAAWCSFIQRLKRVSEMLCQFWQRNSDALLALELTVQEADNQRGMIGFKKPCTRPMLQVIGKLVLLHNCQWEYVSPSLIPSFQEAVRLL